MLANSLQRLKSQDFYRRSFRHYARNRRHCPKPGAAIWV